MPLDNPFEPMIKNIGNYVSGTLYAQGVIPPIGINNYDGTALASPADTHLLAAKDPVIDEIAVGMTGNLIGENTVTGAPPLQLPHSAGYPLRWLNIALSPYQEGTGDPAPDNVRPIHGTDKVTVYTDSKYGGLVEWNQIFPFDEDEFTGNGVKWSILNGKVTVSGTSTVASGGFSIFPPRVYNNLKLKQSHKYFLFFDGDTNTTIAYSMYYSAHTTQNVTLTDDKTSKIFTPLYDDMTDSEYVISLNQGNTATGEFYTYLCDLTQMFGAGNEPSTVDEFRALFPNDYYAYDTGTQKTVDQVNGSSYQPTVITIPTLSANQWDEEWEVGSYSVQDGAPSPATDRIRSKNFITCEPQTEYYYSCNSGGYSGNLVILYYDSDGNYLEYYNFNPVHTFTTPQNCHRLMFFTGDAYGTTYNHDIAINYPSSVTTYNPYTDTIYGGTYDAVSGLGVIDREMWLGSELTWEKVEGSQYRNFIATPSNAIVYSNTDITVISSHYKGTANNYATAVDDNYVWANSQQPLNRIAVKDTSKAALTADEFKAAVADVQFVCQLQTPIPFSTDGHSITLLQGNTTIWATSEDGSVDSMSASYIQNE